MQIPRFTTVLLLVIALASCAKRTEITLPPIDASATRVADALVVRSDYAEGVRAPTGVIRGAGEGAGHAALGYFGAVATAGGDGAIVGLLLAPVALPIAAIIGASSAHSAEEVDAARDAFTRLGNDTAFMKGVERRLIDALHVERVRDWTCVAAASESAAAPCPGAELVATLTLRPRFSVAPEGRYSPDIHLFAEVMASASVGHPAEAGGTERVVEAKWAFREEVGGYFELAADDARLMRQRLGGVMDRLVARIVRDLFTAPAAEKIVQVTPPGGRSFVEVPRGIIVRTEQGKNLVSPATHAVIWPRGSWSLGSCWIAAIDAEETQQTDATPFLERRIEVREGEHTVDVACLKNPGSVNERLTRTSVVVNARAGNAYRTDGHEVDEIGN